ncbi:MAG: HNH endonuclease [Chloroflexi bacterium]|nr:HNH endonuclease [Chloroflexota bacterium]
MVIRMEIDHILPESAGGQTIESNLCLACGNCNRHKGKQQTALDPITSQEVSLYSPRTQTWEQHFRWDEAGTMIIGSTPIGRATVIALKMNHDDVVKSRTLWVKLRQHPPRKTQ